MLHIKLELDVSDYCYIIGTGLNDDDKAIAQEKLKEANFQIQRINHSYI